VRVSDCSDVICISKSSLIKFAFKNILLLLPLETLRGVMNAG